jgi:hypothetical protein
MKELKGHLSDEIIFEEVKNVSLFPLDAVKIESHLTQESFDNS